jgi:hypothetical protein
MTTWCKSFAMGQTELVFPWSELGVDARTPVFVLNSLAAQGNIAFTNNVDGAFSLAINSTATGNGTFLGNVGQTTPLTTITTKRAPSAVTASRSFALPRQRTVQPVLEDHRRISFWTPFALAQETGDDR